MPKVRFALTDLIALVGLVLIICGLLFAGALVTLVGVLLFVAMIVHAAVRMLRQRGENTRVAQQRAREREEANRRHVQGL